MSKRVIVFPQELNDEIQELANNKAGSFYGLIEEFEQEKLIDSGIAKTLRIGAKHSHYGLADGIKELINKYK